ncbi:MAG: DUF6455 family protein [Pseudomonadota bacterium]
MSNAHRYNDHEQLMTQLAAALGVDLDLKMQSGELTPNAYEDAVLACMGCSDPEGCRLHVQQNSAKVPTVCRNRGMFEKWSEELGSSD